ncbi:MAG TPA: HDIG domain-containing protein, partial [Bacteroidia bacterium]|nr:HDIG domain-containing protein [Bacteroidia bacterium]
MNLWNLIRDKHALVFKLGLYLFSTLLLTWLLPSDKRISEKTLYTLNFWPYEDLHAEFVFDFKKSSVEIENEKQKLLKESPLYFRLSNDERNDNLKRLDEQIKSSASSKKYNLIRQIMDSVYARGVIERVEGADTSSVIFVINNGIAEQNSRFDFFTIQEAIRYFNQKLSNEADKDELIQECIKHLALTVRFDKVLTEKSKTDAVSGISHIKSTFLPGDLLVKQMESLSSEKKVLILSYLQASKHITHSNFYNFSGRFIISAMLFGILMLYLAFFRRNIFGQNKQISFIYLVVILSAVVSSIVSTYGTLFFWSLPFALIPVLIRIFFDSRTALFTFLITILFSSFFANDKFQFVFIQLIVGMGTVFSVVQMRRRKELLTSALVVFVFYLFAFIAFHLVNGNEKVLLQKTLYLPIIISSLLILLAYPFVFLAEKVFGFVSDFTLMELCDLNTPLLRELSLKVPGTFQHSLQVANLAEEAIFHIGGNALLVRAGAMYHDIGKMENSRYFTEN